MYFLPFVVFLFFFCSDRASKKVPVEFTKIVMSRLSCTSVMIFLTRLKDP